MAADGTRRTRAFEEVLLQVEHRIAGDGLKVGDRLPGERQLAEQLGVSRASVREAIRVLETLGVVSSQVGRGPDAGAVLTSRPDSALTDLLRLSLSLSSLSLREVIDTRLMIERWSAEHAAHTANANRAADVDGNAGTDGDTRHDALAAAAAAMEAMDAARDPEEFVRHDIAFHVAIAEASGNRLVAAVMRALRGAMRKYAIEAVERLGDTGVLREDHRRIHRAVLAGDAATAAEAVTVHLAHAYPELF
ncbi:GntR family transcriptional regulator [Sphaerisporangium melleum]|uniref:GntR family transcriptional regulator n=1 Tax=Sphaerisporangium melleum TaxID=321316 RepID=A0A917VPT8_9ACTN|nr:FCD domain-containing protein [Sphaerisporangium melleum]GGL06693.1 GntR family transcriptional regulator [Sphaerisporangium melleum]GII74219.1 GntR family transcriptional regulator [Sphaerisporangium melleum]